MEQRWNSEPVCMMSESDRSEIAAIFDSKSACKTIMGGFETGTSKLKSTDLCNSELNALVAIMDELLQDEEEVTIEDMRHKLLNWIDESSRPSQATHLNLPELVANSLSTKATDFCSFEEIYTFHAVIADFLHKCHLGKTLRTFIAETTPILSNTDGWRTLKYRLLTTSHGQNTLDKSDLQSVCSTIPIHKEVTNLRELSRLYKKYPEASLLKLLFMIYDTAAEYLGEEITSFTAYMEDAINLLNSINLKTKAMSYLYRHLKGNYRERFKNSDGDHSEVLNDFVKLFFNLNKNEVMSLEKFVTFMDNAGLTKQDIHQIETQISKGKENGHVANIIASHKSESSANERCKFCGAQKLIQRPFLRSHSVPNLKFAAKPDNHILATAVPSHFNPLLQRFHEKMDASTQISEGLSVRLTKATHTEPTELGRFTRATNTEPTDFLNNSLDKVCAENEIQENAHTKENLLTFDVNQRIDLMNTYAVMDINDRVIDSVQQHLEANLAKSNLDFIVMKARMSKRIQQLTEQLAELKCMRVENADRKPGIVPPSSQVIPKVTGPSKAAIDFEKSKMQLENLKEKFAEISAEYERKIKSRVLRPCNQDS